MLTQSS